MPPRLRTAQPSENMRSTAQTFLPMHAVVCRVNIHDMCIAADARSGTILRTLASLINTIKQIQVWFPDDSSRL